MPGARATAASRRRRMRRPGRSRGQAALFLLMALVVLLAVFLRNVDIHSAAIAKTKAQNAGDAAALAAARWQANTLNLVGELNVAHAAALAEGDAAAVQAITSMQARVLFAGPLTAIVAAQTAARKNGIRPNQEFSSLLRHHAAEVLEYGSQVAGGTAMQEPYPGAWRDYHDSLLTISANGLVAAPDNARFFGDASGGHILRDKAFYEAVAGREWCWFFLNYSSGENRTILDDFTDYRWFPPLPAPPKQNAENSEIFGVGAVSRPAALSSIGGLADVLPEISRMPSNALHAVENWYFYSPTIWQTHWPQMSEGDSDFLPLVGSVRKEYDYTGADAVTRLYAPARTLSGDSGDAGQRDILWTAAARPFGYLRRGSDKIRPNALGIILPAFRDVRLIPMDAASSGNDATFDIAWHRHTGEHLTPYLASGTLVDGCRYCRDIRRFEDPKFRRAGSEWLSVNSYKCTLPSFGTGRGGGTRRGH